MPKFPEIDPLLDREKSIDMILYSIALEETALSRIIEAESEKINYVIENIKSNCCCNGEDVQKLLEVNKSVESLLETVSDMQIILKNKIKRALEGSLKIKPHWPWFPKPPCPPKPPKPPKPPCPPCPPIYPGSCLTPKTTLKPQRYCAAVFEVIPNYIWHQCDSLELTNLSCCQSMAKLKYKNNKQLIELPPQEQYNIKLDFSFNNIKNTSHIILELILCCEERESIQRFELNTDKNNSVLFNIPDYKGLNNKKRHLLWFKLISPQQLKVNSGIIKIK